MKQVLLIILLLASNVMFAQKKRQKAVVMSSTPTLSHLVPKPDPAPFTGGVIKLKRNFKNRAQSNFTPAGPIHYKDPVLQASGGTSLGSHQAIKAPTTSLGVNFNSYDATGAFPPDPTGEVGLNHYVHSVNDGPGATYKVYDKSGFLQGAGTYIMNDINTGIGNTGGDPIVIYDEYANRWLLTEFDDNTDSIYIHVSTSSNPLGTFTTYRYKMPSGFPDYPKYAVWGNAYALGINDNNGSIVVFNRSQMLAGTAAQMAILPSPSFLNGFGFQVWQPIDMDGDSINSTATPMPLFIRHNDDESHVGNPVAGQDFLQLYQFNINWASPNTSTFTQVANIAISEFDSDLCGLTGFSCIKQQGTNVQLDPLREVVMNKPSYRRFANYESIVCCFVTDVNSNDRSGIRWVELRKIGNGAWFKYQEGTYAPSTDAHSRWMPSIAQDKNGNIALAYSIASTTKYPSLRYTGRKSCDSLGKMTMAEQEFATANNNQSAANRWGDYFQMSVDPVDDETFWFVGEYVNGTFWDTRIVSFKFNPDSTNASPIAAIVPTGFCGNSNTVKVVIQNKGLVPISSAQIKYKLNNGAYNNFNYTGTIAPSANDTVTITISPVAAGTNTYTFISSLVNGAADNYRCDDTLSVTVNNVFGGSVSANISTVQITCNNANNGSISVTPTSGSAPYQYSLNNGPFGNSNLFSNLSAGTYSVYVQDASGCAGLVGTTTLINPAAINATLSTVNICPGSTTGSITVNASGGTGAYQYKLNAGAYQTSNLFGPLGAGAYVITIKDANNCTTTLSGNISTISTPMTINGTVSNATCFGNCNGAISLNITGGTAPYTTAPTSNNLCAGAYTFTVTDASGCTKTYNNTITQPAAINIAVNNVTPTCGTLNTGQISVSATGSGAMQYQLNSGAFQTSGNFSGLGAATYTIIAKDASGCTKSTTVNLNGGQNLNINVSTTSPLCFSDCNGSAIVSSSNGVAPVQYDLNGQGFLSNGAYNSLCAGVYTFTVSDATGCSNSTIITMTEPVDLALNPTFVDPLCTGNCNGNITINATGGTTPYDYKINSGLFTTNPTFVNLCANIFTLTVKDANGCSKTTTQSLVNPPLLNLTVSKDTICNNTATGILVANGSGGIGAYTYALNTNPYQSVNSFTALPQGTYTISVKDANGCTKTKTAIVSIYPIINIVTSITNNLCSYGNIGSIAVSASNGFAPYQYAIDTDPYQINDTFSSLENGSYLISVKDSLGCENTTVANVGSPQPLLISVTGVHIKCYDADDGILNMSASGGTPNYTFAYNTSPFVSATQFSPLSPSTYSLYVLDANGCIDSTTMTLTEPTNMSINVSATPNTGGNNGTITITASGGTPNYTYTLNNGVPQSGSLFSNLSGGNYTVMATDANGCTESRIIKVDFPTTVQEFGIQNMVQLFPNPSSGLFSLQINSEEPLGKLELKIYDMFGQQVTQAEFVADQKQMTQQFDFSKFAKAHYTLIVTDNKQRQFITRLVLKN